jgi:hypothetical protein
VDCPIFLETPLERNHGPSVQEDDFLESPSLDERRRSVMEDLENRPVVPWLTSKILLVGIDDACVRSRVL